MNKSICRATVFLLLFSLPLFARSRHDVLRGALVGAATGALLSEVSSGVHARTAIPLFAGIGALTGYSLHHAQYSGYDATPYGWYGSDPIYYRNMWGRNYRQRWNRSRRIRPEPVRTASSVPARTPDPKPSKNLHPGVERVPIQIALPSGFPVTIHIMHTGGQWVGPRGETYTNMPNAQQLQEIYTP